MIAQENSFESSYNVIRKELQAYILLSSISNSCMSIAAQVYMFEMRPVAKYAIVELRPVRKIVT